jgi:hypothetical protein
MNNDIKREIEHFMQGYNHRGVPEFEGYSPHEMWYILYNTFGDGSPLHLNKLKSEAYRQSPMFNQVRYLAECIVRSGELKLTAKGYLPPKIVEELYVQGYLKEEIIEHKLTKVFREYDLESIALARILLELSGIIKKRHGVLSPTKTAEKILADDQTFFQKIFTSYTDKFYWPYLDGHAENNIGKLGYGFSLILLNTFGMEKHSDAFYSERYFRAFPDLLSSVPASLYHSAEENARKSYILRTFSRFLFYFGLVSLSEKNLYIEDLYIQQTALFKQLFSIDKPKNDQVLQNDSFFPPQEIN